jgi:YcxB-like protein
MVMDIRVELPPNNEWLEVALRRASRKQLLRVRVIAGAVVAAGGLLVVASFGDPGAVAPATVLIGLGCLLLWVAWRSPRQAVRRQPRYVRSEPTVLEVTDRGFAQTYPSARSELAWSAFERVVETPDMWLFYTGRLHVLYLPKQPLNEADQAELRAFVAGRQLNSAGVR